MAGSVRGHNLHDEPVSDDRPVIVGGVHRTTIPSVAAGDVVDFLVDAAGRLYVNTGGTGASEVKSIVVVIGATSVARSTAINPTSGKKVRIISVEAQAFGLSTDPDAVYVYFHSGAAYTTTPGKAIAALYTGTKGSDSRSWAPGDGPIGADDEDVSWRTETETETSLLLTVHYREE